MRYSFRTKFISFLIIFCLLTVGIPFPVSAMAALPEEPGLAEAVSASGTSDEISDNSEQTSGIPEMPEMPVSDDCGIFQHIDREEFETAGHTVRLEDLEELNTYVFQNSDGSRTVYYMEENVKYIDSDGTVREKNLSLVAKSNGFGIAQSDIELLLPKHPEDGVDLSCSGHSVKLIPQGISAEVTAETENNSVVYAEAFGAATSLQYTPLLSGVKEDIVLSAYTAQSSYDFILETDGLCVYEDDSGYYLGEASKSEPVFRLGEVIAYDAVGKPSEGTMSVTALAVGERYSLTISVPDDFLADPDTVYPVTIDPTVKVSDTQNGAGAIQDAPIFKGYPDKNFGIYLYNRVGTPSAAYGIGRTAVKLDALIHSNEYRTISANQITRVIFYAKEASGGASQFINLHPLLSNKTWTEKTVTWNNVGTYAATINCGTTMCSGKVSGFDITRIVKDWKNGAYPAEAGFIMINKNESNNKCFYSSEIAAAAKRPYVVMTYKAGISLNASTASVVEGGTRTLKAVTSPQGQKVTWTSDNQTVATVSSSGVITAKKAGTAVITASYVDADGKTQKATCKVYVCIPNGVYYIKNLNSNYYLHVKDGAIANLSDVCQQTKYPDSASDTDKIQQMWKIYYLGNGRYSIRPMNKLSMGLDVTKGNIDICNIGTKDTLRQIPAYGEWGIEWYSTGYVFKNDRSNNKTMQVKDASKSNRATVISSVFSTSVNCRWNLSKVSSPPSGAYLYDKENKTVYRGDKSKYIIYGSAVTLNSLNLEAIAYSGASINQSFSWMSNNKSVASIVPATGTVTGGNSGSTLITGRIYINGQLKRVFFNLTVIGAEQYKAGVRIATVNGKQYYDYTKPANALFKKAVAQCGEHRCMNWEQYYAWTQGALGVYHPNVIDYRERQLGSFLWFYKQVNHNAVWDIKREARWREALPDVPYLGNSGEFVYRGEVKDAEALGNIMYGYTGRATGFGAVTLYWGGGVAAKGSVAHEEVTKPPTYGDDENDHKNIEWGYNLFCTDYPNYPAVGYEGIPLDGWLAEIADVILNPGT